ncbi:FadR/GntR family transcriptional regulator [Leifsonia sp. Leaf336]|uniref:FadR/GntR family transcriptional regulator n=1 Tax=Leifsonia sp. Leaf336 TaxID=1736341 RepID=UPI0009EA7407|nr:FCD domain-containing protein [Leifsonia sp. Leaf336]
MSPSYEQGGSGLHGDVLEWLGTQIITRVFATGHKLNPDELSVERQVSRAVLREVFRVLQAKGLITARPRQGTLVTPPEYWDYMDPDVIRWRLRSSDRADQVEELFALRLAVEPVACRLMAEATDAAAADRLDEFIAEMQSAFERRDLHAFAAADVRFHTHILESSANNMFRSLMSPVASAVSTRETLQFPLEQVVLRGLDLHRRLVAEIRGNGPAIEAISQSLILDAQQEIEAAIH